jgi:hypothetical protein
MFTPSFTPRGEHYLLFRRMAGRTWNIFTPREQNYPLEDNFAPGIEVKNGPQGFVMQSVPYIRDAIASYYGAIHGILVRVTR